MNTYLNQYNSARTGLKDLSGRELNDEELLKMDLLRAQRDSALAEGSLAILGGASSLVGMSKGLADINDTSYIEGGIDDISRIGRRNYSSFGEMVSDYDRLRSSGVDINYDDIRGASTREQIGGILSSTASGATTGLTVGGPWGALIGGVVGLGAGALGAISGNDAARRKEEQLRSSAQTATFLAQNNLNSAAERYSESQFRNRMNISKNGGEIERSLTVKEFADKVLGNQRRNDITHSSGLMIRKCNGGTMIRIKR